MAKAIGVSAFKGPRGRDLRFTADFIDKVRESNDIVELIGQYVQLQKAGSSFRGLCPFPGHREKSPSFFVSDVKQLYHCFGCQKSGSVYNFLMDFQGMSFPEAVEYLAHKSGIPLPAPESGSPLQESIQDEKEVFFRLNRYAGAHFHKSLLNKPEDHPVRRYIKARRISEDTIKEFKLGYAEPGWTVLTDLLKRARAPLEAAEKLGLIKKKSDSRRFDLFRDRLMFPILAANGNVLGFGGRSLSDEQQPKYLNSSESPIFHKGKTLYGLHLTAKHIRAQNEAFVVEGYMDLLALYQQGIKNVVATLGTAFTADHARSLQKLCSKVVALFDGDEAGQAAADKSLPIFLETGMFSRCLTLPGQRDPDEFLNEFGVDEFLKLAGNAPDHFLTFMARKLVHYKGLPTEKVEILNQLTPILERVRDHRLRILYLQEVADRLNVTPQWVSQQIKANTNQPTEIANKIKNQSGSRQVPTEESILVQFMLHKREYLELVNSTGAIDKFVSEEARMIAQSIVEKYCQNPNDFDKLGASLLSQGQDTSGAMTELITNSLAFQTQNSELDEAGERQLIQDCLTRVKERDLKIRSKSILNSIKIDQDSSAEKLEVFLKIAKEQKGLKNP